LEIWVDCPIFPSNRICFASECDICGSFVGYTGEDFCIAEIAQNIDLISTCKDITNFVGKALKQRKYFIALVKDFKIMELKIIPTGNSKEDVEVRKKIIKDFYKQWEKNNPSKKLYNYNLKDYINVRLISIQETAFKASCNYLSTLAVLQLDAILQLARKICVVNTKPKDKNQNQFEKMIRMEYNLVGIGKVSLIVGIKRPNRNKIKEKVQYCITAIKA